MPFLIKKATTRWVVLNKNSGKHLAKGEVSKEVLWDLPVFSNQLDSGFIDERHSSFETRVCVSQVPSHNQWLL